MNLVVPLVFNPYNGSDIYTAHKMLYLINPIAFLVTLLTMSKL